MRTKHQSISRRALIGFVAGVSAAALALGSSAAYAFFTSQAQASGSVTTKSIAITQVNFSKLGATYINSELASTGTFSVTNTGQTVGTPTVSVSSSAALASKLPVRMWPVANAAACTPTTAVPSSAAQGTWAQISLTGANTLAVNASQMYCVRTQVAAGRQSLEDVGGDLVADANLSATLTGEGWTSAPATAVATQRTDDIYPLDATVVPAATSSRWYQIKSEGALTTCLDVESSGTGVPTATNVISYSCTNNANQRFRLAPVNESDPTLVTIAPKHTPGARLSVTAAGVQVIEQTSASSINQRWYIQTTQTGSTQLVSALDGRCLSLTPGTTTANYVVKCNTAAAKLTLERNQLTFSSGSANSFTLDLTAQQNGTAPVLQMKSGGSWSTVAAPAVGSKQISYSPGVFADAGTFEFRIVYAGQSSAVMYEGIFINIGSWPRASTAVAGFD